MNTYKNYLTEAIENQKDEALDFKYREEQLPLEFWWNSEKCSLDTRVRTFPKIDNTEDNTEQGWENQDRQQEYQASQQYNESSQPY